VTVKKEFPEENIKENQQQDDASTINYPYVLQIKGLVLGAILSVQTYALHWLATYVIGISTSEWL
jgi:hypothetical protein